MLRDVPDKLTKKKYTISVLGCRTNQYEAQAMKDQLEAMGYVQALDGEEADISIVNTCTVTEGADASSRHSIRALAKKSPQGRLVVTGCLAERAPNDIVNIKGVSALVPNQRKELLVQDLFPGEEVPEFSIRHFEAHTRAFVKVQDGCNSFCTYCIIPYVRGRSRSRDIPSIVAESEALIRSGYKEIVLTGINIGDFDGAVQDQHPPRLSDLVRKMDELPGLERLRISSIDPDEVDDDLLNAVMHGRKTCHSLHIVLQSGSNKILKRMNRKYTRQMFLETIRRLKSFDPDFSFTTDVIVGFPGETEADFLETMEILDHVQFAKVHMFPYSDRPGTRSALYKDKVSQEVIRERKHRLLKKAEEAAFVLRGKYIGATLEVLTERREEADKKIFGYTTTFLPVFVQDLQKLLSENTTVRVIIESNSPEGLIGRIAS